MLEVFVELTVSGDAAALDRFVDTATARLPAGWTRDLDSEVRINADRLSGKPTFVFACELPERTGKALLFLVRDQAALRLTNVVPRGSLGRLTRPEYNGIVRDFETKVARPVAHDLGLRVHRTRDKQPIEHWLGEEAVAALRLFSSHANKGTGSGHPSDFEFWASFLVKAHLGNASLHSDMLQRWLVEEEHWPPDIASNLTDEYDFARRLLTEYDKRR